MRRRLVPALLLVVLGLALLASPSVGHETTGKGSWYWQRPLPQGNYLNDVDFSSSTRGWAVGTAGTILHTSNGGATWYADVSGTGASLGAVEFVDDNNGWAVGSSGTILHTTDGGAHWSPQASNAGDFTYLYDVQFTSATDGWAVGTNWLGVVGVLLRTVDGGAHWSNVTPGAQSSLFGLTFTSPSDGWIVGAGGKILRTTDAGDSWAPVASGTLNSLYAITFGSATEGWAVGYGGTIRHTSDGGDTWAEGQDPGWSNAIYDVKFTSSTDGWATGELGELLSTTNGGVSWNRTDPVGDLSLSSLIFTSATDGWIVGAGGVILATSDGGTNWNPQSTATNIHLQATSAVDTATAWAVGDEGMILHTADGGATWTSQTTTSTVYLNGIWMNDANNGWAVGGSGRIVHTTDGGTNWVEQSSEMTEPIFAVTSTSDSTAWAAGSNGTVIRTTDGGANWVTQPTGVPHHLYGIDFVDDNEGWAVGFDIGSLSGSIVHTSDGGNSWEQQSTGPRPAAVLRKVEFVSSTEGWIVGGDGTILHTTDAGASWLLQESGTNTDLRDVTFVSPTEGWIVAFDGSILHTTDAGAHWDTLDPSTTNELNGVTFGDSEVGWAVGINGTIISTLDPDWATAPPRNVRDFSAAPGDESVSLSWINPADIHYQVTRVLGSDVGFASTPTETVGQYQVYEGTATAASDSGLTNGTPYYYTVFTMNEASQWSLPSTATATPFEPPPGPVTNLTATPWDKQVTLDWTNPTDSDYALTRVLRSEVGFAATPTETVNQTQAYEGTATTYLDPGLTNGTPYYYTLFARDDAGVWSPAATATATPFDPPPGPVTSFTAIPADGRVDLAWNNPVDADYDATRILRSETGYATTAGDTVGQIQVYEGTQTVAADTPLTNGRLYYYTAFARDAVGGWSTRVTASARPQADTTMSVSADVTVTAYGGLAVISGDLQNSIGSVPATLKVTLWQSQDSGASWTKVGTAVYDWGSLTYKATAMMTADSLFQMRFAGNLANKPCTSNNISVSSRAYLGIPVALSYVPANIYFNVYGLLLPSHTGTTKLQFYRYVAGAWRLYSERDATNYAYSSYTRYVSRQKLPYGGRWYVKAYHDDANHAESWSSPRYFTIL